MSSILKALEKVEESRSARRHVGASGIARASERRPAWAVPAGVVGGAAFAALVTFAAMGGFSRTATAVPAGQAQAVATPASLVALPLPSVTEAPAAKPVLTLPIKQAEPAVAPKGKPSPARSPVLAAKPLRAPAASAARPAFVPTPPARPAPANETTATAEAQQVAPEKTRSEIKVTGIAWQKDSASSAALVNGRPVQPGDMVDGLKVEEIFQDKVRFSGNSGKLDVPLGGGL